MQSIKLLIQKRYASRGRECLSNLWQKTRSVKQLPAGVCVATKQLSERTGRISTNFVNLLVNEYGTSSVKFEDVCDTTLDSLAEYFEELIEQANHLNAADVSYGNGVLTVSFGQPYGTYVINRQTPNRQIWLSSPVSGPKRYDFVEEEGCWIYKHDGRSIHELLQVEIPEILKTSVDFTRCAYCRLRK